MTMPLNRKHWKALGGRLVCKFYVAEQSPKWRQTLPDEMESGDRVALCLMTHRRFEIPTPPKPPPVEQGTLL